MIDTNANIKSTKRNTNLNIVATLFLGLIVTVVTIMNYKREFVKHAKEYLKSTEDSLLQSQRHQTDIESNRELQAISHALSFNRDIAGKNREVDSYYTVAVLCIALKIKKTT